MLGDFIPDEDSPAPAEMVTSQMLREQLSDPQRAKIAVGEDGTETPVSRLSHIFGCQPARPG